MDERAAWRPGQEALLKRFATLVKGSRELEAELLGVLRAVDEAKLYAVAGYGSLFAFCVEAHGMSESQASKRIRAARLSRRHPHLLAMLRHGELRLGGIHVLGKLLDECEDAAAVLARAKGRTVRQLEALAAELRPRPDVASSMRRLPERKAEATGAPAARASVVATVPEASGRRTSLVAPSVEAKPTSMAPQRARDPQPLSPGRFRLTVTLDAETAAALRELQDLSAHEQPNRDLAPLVARAIRLALSEKRRAVRKERKPRSPSKKRDEPPRSTAPDAAEDAGKAAGRRAPAAVVREVWRRDGGRCTYVSPGGRRCTETGCLELDHAIPWAKGGVSTAANLRLRCRTHNQLAADESFGRAFMDGRRGRVCRETVTPYTREMNRPRGHQAQPSLRRQPRVKPNEPYRAERPLAAHGPRCRLRTLPLLR